MEIFKFYTAKNRIFFTYGQIKKRQAQIIHETVFGLEGIWVLVVGVIDVGVVPAVFSLGHFDHCGQKISQIIRQKS